MAKIGIYGGSFNPPHLGHILAAKEFRRKLDLDLLLFVPAATPPHKTLHPDSPDAKTRLRLLQLAAQELSFARVDDLELQREGASYTVDTLKELRVKYPEDELYPTSPPPAAIGSASAARRQGRESKPSRPCASGSPGI